MLIQCKLITAALTVATLFLVLGFSSIVSARTEQQVIYANDASKGSLFGNSIALSDNILVVGANHEASDGRKQLDEAGAVYVFRRSGFSWNQIAKLTASDAKEGDKFGSSVAVSEDTIVVGLGNDPKKLGRKINVVYVFTKPATGWQDSTERCTLITTSGKAQNLFGHSVGVSGDTIVVGAPKSGAAGAAFVFTKPASGWEDSIKSAKITPSDGQNGDLFGWSVGISKDTIVVGASAESGGSGDPLSSAGAAYVFVKSGKNWKNSTEDAKLTASDAQNYDEFGYSVAISDDTIVVGALYERGGSGDPLINAGAAYVFKKSPSGWKNGTETAKLSASNAHSHDMFGKSVAISHDTIVVGAQAGDIRKKRSLAGPGAAYLFTKPLSGWKNSTESYYLSPSDAQAKDAFGISVAISGNNIAVGAYKEDGGKGDPLLESGAVYLFIQSSDSLPPKFINAPTISEVKDITAVVQFETDEATKCSIDLGVSKLSEKRVTSHKIASKHTVLLTGLKARTNYQLRVNITDIAGNTPVSSEIIKFKTRRKPDITAPVITRKPIIHNTDDTSVVIEWQTNELATSIIDYGLDATFGQHLESNELTVEHKVHLTDIIKNQIYFAQVSNNDPAGNGPRHSKMISFMAGSPSSNATKEPSAVVTYIGKSNKELQEQLKNAEATILELQTKLTFAEQDKWRVDILRAQLAKVELENQTLKHKLLFFQKGQGNTDVLQSKIDVYESSMYNLDTKLQKAQTSFNDLQEAIDLIRNRFQGKVDE